MEGDSEGMINIISTNTQYKDKIVSAYNNKRDVLFHADVKPPNVPAEAVASILPHFCFKN
jgi:hypothetical protein